jgi:hypothetical protein
VAVHAGPYQDRYSRPYEPSIPTISPYLSLLRPDIGPLPNYHGLVLLMLRQQELNQER